MTAGKPLGRRGGLAVVRSNATTLVILVVALALGVFAYFDRRTVSDAERKDREHDVFPAYRRQDVSKVELSQGAVKVVFERRSEGDAGDLVWWMTSPRNERADAAAVDKLLGDVEFAGIVRKVDASVADKAMDKPRVVGTLTMGPVVYRFSLGDAAPTPEGASYFRVDGEGSYVVSRDFTTSLLKGPDAYRERTVVPYLSLELQRLEVTGRGAGFVIERADDVSFRLPELGLRASRETLDRVWGALAGGRAESFLADDDADRALGGDVISVLMKPKDASRPEGELSIGGPCPGHPDAVVAVRRSPKRLSSCVPKGMVPGLLVTAKDLVDRRLFATRGDEVAELVLESVPPGTKVELARKGTGWHQRSPVDRELASDEVDSANDLVSALTRGEGTDVTAGDPKGPFTARARVTIRRTESKGDEVVELGPSSAGSTLVRRAFDGATLHVPDALAHRLVPSAVALRGKQLFVPSLEGKQARSLELSCDGTSQRVTRKDGGWTMEKPAGYAVDSAAVIDLVNAMARAQAESWVADTDDGSFGFDRSDCSVSLTYDQDGGPRIAGIVFGRPAEGGGAFAHLVGQPGVFLSGKALREEAGRVLIDRAGFLVPTADIDTVTLSRGGARVVLPFRGGKVASAGGKDTELGEKIGIALESLKADDVVHLGPPAPSEGFLHPSVDVRIKTTAEAGAKEVHFVVGESAMILRERMFYARLDGVDATFGLARDRVAPLLDGF